MMLCIYQLTVITIWPGHDHPPAKCPFKGGPCIPCIPLLARVSRVVHNKPVRRTQIVHNNGCSLFNEQVALLMSSLSTSKVYHWVAHHPRHCIATCRCIVIIAADLTLGHWLVHQLVCPVAAICPPGVSTPQWSKLAWNETGPLFNLSISFKPDGHLTRFVPCNLTPPCHQKSGRQNNIKRATRDPLVSKRSYF